MSKRFIQWNPFARLVAFSPEEITALRAHANERQTFKERNMWANPQDRRITRRDYRDLHFQGVLGEAALAKILGIPFDEGLYLKGRPFDFEISGITIEVKTQQGYLLFNTVEELISDLVVLCVADTTNPQEVAIQGYIPRTEFIKHHFVDDFGYGPRLCVQPITLYAIDTLKPFCFQLQNMRMVYRQMIQEGNQ